MGIADYSYDFLLSSNCLEHVANPLKALFEWHRVLRPGGYLILVLPRKDGTFDHRRSVTTFEHIFSDFKKGVGEDDMTHLEEILQLHDLSLDPPAGTLEQFRARSLKNGENRTLHHHVFDLSVVDLMLKFTGFHLEVSCADRVNYFALALRS